MAIGPGSVIDERYALKRELGAGGMAEVYLADDQLLDREVAVKMLSARYAADPSFVERFRREASSAARLNHPNIVAVYDRGETNGSYYIVMEYLDGLNLKELIRRDGPLPPGMAIDYTLQILAALGAAHKRDIVHLDAKPQNMMLADEGLLKVTDFGIARAGGRSDLTSVGSVIGTAQYLSPEQARGEDVTAASDCYSAGIVLYEMLTGRVPFDGDQPMAVAMKQINEQPSPPRVHRPDLPEDLNAVVMKALAKRPSERYRTAEEFAAALRPIRERFGPAATAVMGAAAASATQVMQRPEATAATQVSTRRPPPRTPPPPTPSSKRAWWIAAVAVLAIAAVAVGLLMINGSIGGGGGGVTIPPVAGQDEETALRTLADAGLTNVQTRQVSSNDVPSGSVVRTSPVAGQEVTADARVDLLISSGPDTIELPSVIGDEEAKALQKLRDAGFANPTITREENDAVEGIVFNQTPSAGDVSPDSQVTIFVSQGPGSVTIPDLTSTDRNDAARQLRDLGLDPRVVGEENGDFPPNTVIRTEPGSGEEVEKGEQVRVVIAQPPQSAEVPSVIGESQESGTAILESVGFAVRSESVTDPASFGEIIDQSPIGGSEVPRGRTVTITVSAGPGDETSFEIPPPPDGGSVPPAPEPEAAG